DAGPSLNPPVGKRTTAPSVLTDWPALGARKAASNGGAEPGSKNQSKYSARAQKSGSGGQMDWTHPPFSRIGPSQSQNGGGGPCPGGVGMTVGGRVAGPSSVCPVRVAWPGGAWPAACPAPVCPLTNGGTGGVRGTGGSGGKFKYGCGTGTVSGSSLGGKEGIAPQSVTSD